MNKVRVDGWLCFERGDLQAPVTILNFFHPIGGWHNIYSLNLENFRVIGIK